MITSSFVICLNNLYLNFEFCSELFFNLTDSQFLIVVVFSLSRIDPRTNSAALLVISISLILFSFEVKVFAFAYSDPQVRLPL